MARSRNQQDPTATIEEEVAGDLIEETEETTVEPVAETPVVEEAPIEEGKVVEDPKEDPIVEDQNVIEDLVIEDAQPAILDGEKGFIQAAIDLLPQSEKDAISYAVADILASGMPKETIVSIVVNSILDKVVEKHPEAKEVLSALAQSIFDNAMAQVFAEFIAEFDGVIASGMPTESRLSIWAQGLDNFAAKLG